MTRSDGVFNTQMVLERLLAPWADRLESVTAMPAGPVGRSMTNSKPGLLTLTIKDKSALYLAYMPYVKNGGLFIPTSSNYRSATRCSCC
jgi:hypothetical protein